MSKTESEPLTGAALIEAWETTPDQNNADPTDAYLLVERSAYDGSHYLTSHASRKDAAEYHDSQEYPEDWGILHLFDLRTGKRFYAVPSTSFVEAPQ